MSLPSLDVLEANFRKAAAVGGFDIVHRFTAQWYNDYLAQLQKDATSSRWLLQPLPTFEQRTGCAAFLVGNTKAAWRPFLHWLSQHQRATGRLPDDPFDSFCEQTLEAVCEATLAPRGIRYHLFWSSVYDPQQGHMVSMQRAAEVSGLGHLDHTTHLLLHPHFGAWLSLRAVVVLDLPAHPAAAALPPPPAPLPCPLSACEQRQAGEALEKALAASRRQSAAPGEPSGRLQTVEPAWQAWLALRDVVVAGRRHRFEADMLEYHYRNDPAILRRALAAFAAGQRNPPRWKLPCVVALVVGLSWIAYKRPSKLRFAG